MKIKTVGVAGSLCRIGTTTQAIQLVKYLKLMGYSTAYVEMNSNGYIDSLINYYEVKAGIDCVIFEDVELYKREKILVANKKEYEYLIKDYGSIDGTEFESISFTEQEIRIVTCGSKPNELQAVERVLRNPVLEDIQYMFSFVPKEERAALKEMMDDYADRTFFVEYTPDPYEYLSVANNVCKAVLRI